MPIQFSDEDLDELNALDDDGKQAVLSKLSDEDLDAIHTAWESRTKRLQPAAPIGVPKPQPLAPKADVPELVKETKSFLDLPPDMATFKERFLHNLNPMNVLNEAKDKYVVPAVEAVQENLGRPAVEANISTLKSLVPTNAQSPELLRSAKAVGELGMRSASQFVAGPKVLEEMDEATKLKAVNDLESVLGVKGSAFALGLAEQVGQAPLLFTGTGAGGKVAQIAGEVAPKAGILGRILTHVASGWSEGSIMGAADAAIKKGESLEKGALTGGAAGVLLGAGGALVAEIPEAITGAKRVVAALDPMNLRAFHSEMDALPIIDPVRFRQVEPYAKDIKPSVATIRVRDGQIIASVKEIRADGSVKGFVVPIYKSTDAAKFGEYVGKHNVHTDWSLSPEELNTLSQDNFDFIGEIRKNKDLFNPELVKFDPFDPKRLEAKNKVPRDSESTGDLLDAPEPKKVEGAVVVQDGDHLKVQSAAEASKTFINPEKANAPFERRKSPSYELEPTRKTTYKTVAEEMNAKARLGVEPQMPWDVQAPDVKDLTPPPLLGGGGNSGGNGGPPLPPTPPSIPPPTPDKFIPNQTEDLQLLYKLARQGENKPGLWEAIKRQAIPLGLHGPADIARALSLNMGVRNVGVQNEIYKALLSKFNTIAEFSKAADGLKLVGRGKLTMAEWEAQHGPASADAKQFFADVMQRIQDNHRILQELGFVPEDLHPDDLDRYVAELYRAHWMKPGEWARNVPDEVVARARDFLAAQNKGKTDNEIEYEINKILKAEDPFEVFKSSRIGSKWANLKARKDLPQPIKDLLGVEGSGFVSMAMTLGNQEQILANARMWHEVVANPNVFRHEPAPGWLEVPPNPKQFGPAAGGYIRPEAAPLLGSPKFAENAHIAVRNIVSMMKGNHTVFGGARPWLNNIIRNLPLSGTLSGGIDIFRPLQTGKSLVQAAKMWRAFHANPVGKGGKLSPDGDAAAYIMAAKRLGLNFQGELASQGLRDVNALNKALTNRLASQDPNKTDLWAFIKNGGEFFKNLALNRTRGHEFFKEKYDAIDPFFKLASLINIHKSLLKRKWDNVKAFEEAVLRVRISYADYSNTAPAVETLAKSGRAGADTALFLRGSAEEFRLMYHGLPAMLRRDPEAIWRLMASAAAVAAMAGAMAEMRRRNGISDQEVELATRDASRRNLTYRHGVQFLPFRDKNGALIPFDWSGWFTPLQLAHGSPEDPWWVNAIYNVAGQLMGPGLEPGIRKTANNMGLINRPNDYQPPTLEGDRGPLQVIARLNELGLAGPTAIGKAVRDVSRMGGGERNLGRTTEKFTPGEVIARNVGGLPIASPYTPPINPATGKGQESPSHRAAQLQQRSDKKELESEMRQIAMKTQVLPGDSAGVVAQKRNLAERLKAAALEKFNRRTKVFIETQAQVQQLRKQR